MTDSQCFKLAHFGICLHQRGSLKKPYCRTECVGMVESDVIAYMRGGATAKVKFMLICDSCKTQLTLQKQLQNVSEVAGPSP